MPRHHSIQGVCAAPPNDILGYGLQENRLRRDRPTFSRGGQSARRGNTCEVRFGLIIVSFCLLNTANAQTQIHKCTDADGGVAYSQLPCAAQKFIESEKMEPDAKAESAIPKEEPKREYSPDKAEQYKQRLLLLSRKLRQC